VKPQTSLRAALADPNLLDLGAPSWAAWRPLLLSALGEPLLPDELELYRRFTGRSKAPTKRVDEAWIVAGRRAGKTRAMASLATYLAALCDHSQHLARGQRGYVLVVAPDLKQAGELIAYCRGREGRSGALEICRARTRPGSCTCESSSATVSSGRS
jgi:hypothetical protein